MTAWDIAQVPEPPKWTVKICPHGCRFRANATSTKAALEALIDHIEWIERPDKDKDANAGS